MDVITSHTNADFDTLGGMVGAKKLYPDARVVFPGSMEKGLRDAVGTLDLACHPPGCLEDFRGVADEVPLGHSREAA